MSYNILNKNVKFQGATQGTIEDIVDLHSDQTVGGKKTITNLTGTHAIVSNDLKVSGFVGIGTDPTSVSPLKLEVADATNANYGLNVRYLETTVATNRYAAFIYAQTSNGLLLSSPENGISSTAKYHTLEQTQNGGYGLKVSRNLGEAGSEPLVNFINDHSSNGQPTLRLQQDGTGDLLQGNYQGATILKINRSGSIGIQTTHPEAELHVVGQVTCSLGITASAFHGSGVSLTGVTTALKSGGGLAYSSNELTIDMSSVTDAGSTINNTDEVLITQGGALKKIDATRIASLFQQTITGYTGAGNNRIITSVDSDEIQGEPNLTFDGSVLTVTGTGSLSEIGIGTASPDAHLEINKEHPKILMKSNSADGDGQIIFKSGDGTQVAQIRCDVTSNALNHLVIAAGSNDDHLVVDANGNIGIGVQDPSQKLEIAGAVHVSGETTSPSAPSDGDGGILYVKSDGKLYWISNELSETDLTVGSIDIDALSPLGGTGIHQTNDHFVFSDNGIEKKITFSNLEDAIFSNISSDATVAAGGAMTIANDAVDNNKLANIARGSVKVGGTGNAPTDLDAKTSGQILIGDGTDIASVAISGDVSLASNGTVTIAANAVHDSMINDDVATGLAGNGLVASSGVMAVQVQGALKISSDSVGITGSIAGNGLQATGTADAVSSLAVSVDNSTIEINSDSLRLKDNGVTLAKMAGLARGKIIVGDSSGDPTSLTLGSAGQLLVSDGDDLLYRSVGGDATLGADGTLTIAANAVEGSMLNSNVAGAGLDYGSNQLSVDVSDFMANGVDNRVLTATGADAMTGEANLTFDGSLLTIAGTGSATKLRANYTGGGHTDAVLLISGSNTENLFQIMQQGNGYPTSFLAGENHSLYPGLLYNRGKIANGGTISQGNVEGAAGSHTRLTVRKTSIADNTATSIVTITVPNANHAAAIRVFGLANFDNCNYAQSFSFEGSLARGSGSPVDKAFSSVTTTENAGITPNFTIAAAGSANTGGNSATQTFDLQLTIDTSDGSSSNATIMIELINFNDSGITMAAS